MSVFRNRWVVYLLCVVLAAALGVLLYCERRNPEAGSELVRRLLSRAR